MPVPLELPFVVVLFFEVVESQPQLLHILEPPHPEKLLLQGAHEPLGDAVAFKADKRITFRSSFTCPPIGSSLKIV